MMKIAGFFLSVCITVAGFVSVQAQTADDIVNKCNDAIGGSAVLSKIKSAYIEGVTSVMGNDLPVKITLLLGKGIKTETTYNGLNIIQCLTDTSGWMVNPVQGQATPVAMPADVVKMGKSSLDIRGEIYNFKEKGYTDSLVGREDLNGVSVFKLKLSKPGISLVYFVDPTTYYVLKMETTVTIDGKTVSNASTFSNYKKTDSGYVVAFTTGVNNMGYDLIMNYTKVEINNDIDPKIFAMPK